MRKLYGDSLPTQKEIKANKLANAKRREEEATPPSPSGEGSDASPCSVVLSLEKPEVEVILKALGVLKAQWLVQCPWVKQDNGTHSFEESKEVKRISLMMDYIESQTVGPQSSRCEDIVSVLPNVKNNRSPKDAANQ